MCFECNQLLRVLMIDLPLVLLMLLNAVELIKFVAANVPIV
jgi:hypothetical protein